MLIEILKNSGKIAEGVKNLLIKSKHVEEVAAHRLSICNDCDFIDKEGSDCVAPGTQPCCKKCGCCLAVKTRCMSCKCPMDMWVEMMDKEVWLELKNNIDNETII